MTRHSLPASVLASVDGDSTDRTSMAGIDERNTKNMDSMLK